MAPPPVIFLFYYLLFGDGCGVIVGVGGHVGGVGGGDGCSFEIKSMEMAGHPQLLYFLPNMVVVKTSFRSL